MKKHKAIPLNQKHSGFSVHVTNQIRSVLGPVSMAKIRMSHKCQDGFPFLPVLHGKLPSQISQLWCWCQQLPAEVGSRHRWIHQWQLTNHGSHRSLKNMSNEAYRVVIPWKIMSTTVVHKMDFTEKWGHYYDGSPWRPDADWLMRFSDGRWLADTGKGARLS